MGEVTGVDKAQRCVFVNDPDREHVPIRYDYLILATGARHSYFGHNEFEKFAPGLKSLDDAVGIRNKILSAFEQAEAEENVDLHRDLLTFVLVGAGPTGVEMAAALGIDLLTEAQYRALQELGEFDTRTSSWIRTPPDVRALGGALFCDRRYGKVFVYHNGAQSYYAARGFRGSIRV